MLEGRGIVTAHVDGEPLIGPVDFGVVAAPLHLDAGWHRIDLDLEPREVTVPEYRGYRPPPATKVGWSFTQPYTREPVAVWGGKVMHPDYKGAPGPRRFRRRFQVPERATLIIRAAGSGDVELDAPTVLEPG